MPPEVPFFVVRKQSLLPKVPIFETKKMAEKTAEDGLKSKNARKQSHSKSQFYIGIHVTKVEKNIFLKSTYPKVHSISIIAFLSAQQLHFVQVLKPLQLNGFLSVHLE